VIRTAVLTRDLPTKIGTFAAGVRVSVLGVRDGQFRVCLDTAQHLAWRCHTVLVPEDALALVRSRRADQLPEVDCAVTP
jgi:hypothetical protein